MVTFGREKQNIQRYGLMSKASMAADLNLRRSIETFNQENKYFVGHLTYLFNMGVEILRAIPINFKRLYLLNVDGDQCTCYELYLSILGRYIRSK